MPFYETPNARRAEIVNECFLVGICYHFVIFSIPIWDSELRQIAGTSCSSLVFGLLAFNTVIIIVVSFMAIKRKCYLKKLKKQALKHAEELRMKKMLAESQVVDPAKDGGASTPVPDNILAPEAN